VPVPLPLAVRQAIRRDVQAGHDAARIARDRCLAPRTARRLVARCRLRPDDLCPAYRPGPGRPAADPALREYALALRQQHPSWGAGYIRVRLKLAHPDRPLPAERTLQRWFRRQGQPAAPPGRRPEAEAARGLRPHDTWQMDAAEQMRIAGGQGVSWLRLVDECSGAFLATAVFPPVLLG